MKVIIFGAGRMGMRHAAGIAALKKVQEIVLTDSNESALQNAVKSLAAISDYSKFKFLDLESTKKTKGFDTAIMATTANDRVALFDLVLNTGCTNVLIEKPLGQSLEEVKELVHAVESSGVHAYVNLNMRLYDCFIELKEDLLPLPQLQGFKTITINTGTVGIGANGIHYLDLLFFLLGADKAEIECAYIDSSVIPSGRGSQFADFGGWCVINFYKQQTPIGRAMLSLSSQSTAFGSWEIIAPHGRVFFNEVERKRIDSIRRPESTMPINRYYADYLPSVERSFPSPILGDLTAKWIQSLDLGQEILPEISDSVAVHELMFQWLSFSKSYSKNYPIT